MKISINKPGGKPYKFYRWQKDAIDKMGAKQKCTAVVARQSGKTEIGAVTMLDFLFRYANRKNPRALICMVSQQQAFNFYFKRIDNFLSKLPKNVYWKQGGKDQPLIIYFRRPHFGDIAEVTICGTGNAKALRGGTIDFMILDEMASYPKGLWKTVFEPMTDMTDGKVLLTSTPNGKNMFYDLCKQFKKDEKSDPEFGHIEYDVHTAAVHSAEWIKKKRNSYIVVDQLAKYQQEYENSFTAAEETEAPFANRVHDLAVGEGLITDENTVKYMLSRVTVAVDIGAPGNMAVWHYAINPMNNAITVIDYKDHYLSLKHLLDELYEQYCQEGVQLHIVFPVDVNTPSLTEGGTFLSVVTAHMQEQGYDRVMQVSHLPKVKNKQILWRQGVQTWNRCEFVARTCREGLEKLAGVRFRKTANTEEIKYGEAVANGCQHAADAYLYMCAAVTDAPQTIGGVILDSRNGSTPALQQRPYTQSWRTNSYNMTKGR